ncbi:MAG: SusC/RagA family TonB-linked outer membrane protein [Prevotellaceae bacterium]|jgi:TonB-linked SusC/RagA family outer membrane protein|nr:SusC/RagA family TonB-linked outer membrane protein [Prevotellaceae bacterium]
MKYHKKHIRAKFSALFLALFIVVAVSDKLSARSAGGDSTDLIDVAYGKQERDLVTSSIWRVSGSDLRKTQAATLSNTFFGRIPGMTTIQTDGEPGYDEATLYLRGQHSFRSNSFIILLDGFPIDGFNHIHSEEIESVTYLRDAASLAVYGMNGANGVLLISTKRGSSDGDRMKISLKARYGVQVPTYIPEFEGSYNYARLYNEALRNDGLPELYTTQDLEGYRNQTNPYYYPDVNWYDEILSKTSSIQDYTLSFSGGNRYANYFAMASLTSNNGLYANTDGKNNSNISFDRINFRANVDINITRNLTALVGLGGRIEDRMFPSGRSTAQLWQDMATYAPNLYPVLTPAGRVTGTANYPDNPLGTVLHEGYGSRNSRDVQAFVTLKEKLGFITEGLSVFASFSVSSSYQNGYNKTKTYSYHEPIRTVSSLGSDSMYYAVRGADTDLTVSTGNDAESNRMNIHAGIEYERSFGKHEFNSLLMFQQGTRSVLGDQSSYANRNLLGRLTYAHQRKYLAELSFSYYGTENYKQGHRFGFFPALSLGWVLSEEKFMANNFVNFLKLRASAGLLGSDKGAERFAYNQYWGTASSQGYYFGSGVTYSGALVQLSLANPAFTWEKSMMYNLGIESRFLSNKVSFTADFFYENRYDILVNSVQTMPSFSGIAFSSMRNKGKTRNYGIEVSANYRDKQGELTYSAGAWISFARNKISESYETPKAEERRFTQGRPMGQRFGLEAIGFFRDNTDIENSPVHTFSNVRPGDLKYRDQNRDGFIDIHDEVNIARPSVPEISYALNLGIEYKGFDLEMLFDGNANRSIYLSGYMFWPFINNYNVSSWTAARRWTPETHATASAPRLSTIANENNYRSSDFWVRNLSLLRLRNIELGYNFTGQWLRKLKVDKMRLYLSALNLFKWSNLDAEVDPETLSAGYPVLKTYSFGITLDF